jgi:hypothetical protein
MKDKHLQIGQQYQLLADITRSASFSGKRFPNHKLPE